MRRFLASPRRRRRVFWLAAVLALAAAATILGVYFPNTSPTRHSAKFTKEPVQTVAGPPQSVAFTAQERKEVNAVAGDFIATAVFRERLDHAYDLVVPSFRQGLTRKEWRSGNIPVVPYPQDAVALMRWKLDYSYTNRVGMHVAFLPKQTAKVGGMVFAIELKNVGSADHHRWLVSYWTPTGGQVLSNAQRARAAGQPVTLKPRLGAGWIFAPIGGLLALIVLVPTALGVRGWLARRRVDRTYGTLSS
ncbi:MAG TPA: hypothetical protein VF101_05455 [Gaiellaceae bacterium]